MQTNKTFVTLAEEMQIVRAYLEVEKSRLGERLAVQILLDDAVLPVSIPVLSIQPLVENAIKHSGSNPASYLLQPRMRRMDCVLLLKTAEHPTLRLRSGRAWVCRMSGAD